MAQRTGINGNPRRGAPFDDPADQRLMEAVRTDRPVDVARSLLEGAEPNRCVYRYAEGTCSLLEGALRDASEPVVELLLAAGARPPQDGGATFLEPLVRTGDEALLARWVARFPELLAPPSAAQGLVAAVYFLTQGPPELSRVRMVSTLARCAADHVHAGRGAALLHNEFESVAAFLGAHGSVDALAEVLDAFERTPLSARLRDAALNAALGTDHGAVFARVRPSVKTWLPAAVKQGKSQVVVCLLGESAPWAGPAPTSEWKELLRASLVGGPEVFAQLWAAAPWSQEERVAVARRPGELQSMDAKTPQEFDWLCSAAKRWRPHPLAGETTPQAVRWLEVLDEAGLLPPARHPEAVAHLLSLARPLPATVPTMGRLLDRWEQAGWDPTAWVGPESAESALEQAMGLPALADWSARQTARQLTVSLPASSRPRPVARM